MYIRHLSIKNLKLIRNLDLSFLRDGEPRMWTVLLGPNGLCKTSILQAIALAASGATRAKVLVSDPSALIDRRHSHEPVLVAAEFGFSGSRRHHQLRRYPGIDEKPPNPPTIRSRITLEPGENDFGGSSIWSSIDRITINPTQAIEPLAKVRSGGLSLWFVAGYGVNRMLADSDEDPPSDFTIDRVKSLFQQGRVIGTGFFSVFRKMDAVASGSGTNGRHVKAGDLSERFAAALKKVLVGAQHLLPLVDDIETLVKGDASGSRSFIESYRFAVRAGQNRVSLPATALSQGYQGTIAWIADLVGQIFLEGSGDIPTEEMEGLVLVDELDLHLHPTWQVVLVRILREIFPMMQFVTTTHSPMILPYLRQDELFILGQNEDGDITATPAERSPALLTASDIYATFFGLDEVFPNEIGDALWRYGYLARTPARTDEQERELSELQARLRDAGVDPGIVPVPRRVEP